MIRSFSHKGLRELFTRGATRHVAAALQARAKRWLDALDSATALTELNVPGFDFHALRGHTPTRYTLHVNGPWCITFEWRDGDAHRVDLEQYH